MLIRPATLDDATAIAHVHVETWRTAYRQILPADFLEQLSQVDRGARWVAYLREPEPDRFTVVSELEGQVVGFASGGPERKGDPNFAGELESVYLLAKFQGRGIGRSLLSAVATRLVENGLRSMKVWTLADNAARGFYEHCGGVLIGEEPIQIAGLDLVQVAYGWKRLSE